MSRSAFTPASLQLQQLGLEPKVECVVDGFLALPAFVAGTRRLALVQRHLSAFVLHHPGIRVLECPFEATPITEALWWHPVRTRDPEHAWMREPLRGGGQGAVAGGIHEADARHRQKGR